MGILPEFNHPGKTAFWCIFLKHSLLYNSRLLSCNLYRGKIQVYGMKPDPTGRLHPPPVPLCFSSACLQLQGSAVADLLMSFAVLL